MCHFNKATLELSRFSQETPQPRNRSEIRVCRVKAWNMEKQRGVLYFNLPWGPEVGISSLIG